jgi:hypothetical protein
MAEITLPAGEYFYFDSDHQNLVDVNTTNTKVSYFVYEDYRADSDLFIFKSISDMLPELLVEDIIVETPYGERMKKERWS